MPRQIPPSHKLVLGEAFVKGLCTPLDPAQRQFRGVREEDIHLTGLSSAALTRLLQADYHDMKTPRRTRKHIKAYLQLSHIAQAGVLARNGVYVYQLEPEDPDWVQPDEDDCSLHSEADWGESADGDSLASVSTIDDLPYTPRPTKMARLRGKQVQAGHLEPGYKAVVPVKDDSSRLPRELGRPLWAVDFGMQLVKPALLRKFGDTAGLPSSLTAVAGRETGTVYYSDGPLAGSPTAMWLLQAAGTVSSAYARMQLLLSTLDRQVPMPPGEYQIQAEPELRNWFGVDPDDGMARVSLDCASKLGLLTGREQLSIQLDGDAVYHPYQFRGVLKLADGRTALVKGMMVIDVGLESEMRMPDSCIKIWSTAGLPPEAYGLDLTHCTRPMAQPKLSPSLLTMLKARVALVPVWADAVSWRRRWTLLWRTAKRRH